MYSFIISIMHSYCGFIFDCPMNRTPCYIILEIFDETEVLLQGCKDDFLVAQAQERIILTC